MASRILIVTTDSKICGTERMILSLLTELDRERFQPMLVSLTGPGDLIEEARRMDIKAENLQASKRALVPAFNRWRNIVKQFQPEVLHSFLFHSNLLARFTRIFTKTPVISGLRTVYTIEDYGPWYGRLERWTHRFDRFYIANSELGLQSARKTMKLPAQKLVMIRNGIPPFAFDQPRETIRERIRQEFGIHNGAVVIGVVAQLRPPKRHDLLLQAIASLKDTYPDIRLLIVGEGQTKNRLEQLTRELDIENHVIFTGFRSDVQKILLGMDIFALPSEVEGQPVSIMEAMQAGLPVIATNVGGIPEITQENTTALLSEPGNLQAFTTNLDTLLANPQMRSEMGLAGRERIQSEFSAKRMAQRFQECYEVCLKK